MKGIRSIFILAVVVMIASLGFVAYSMFLGPDRVPITGRSLSELLESGDILPLIIIPVSLIIAGFAMRPFLRIIFPAKIKDGVKAPAKVLKVWDTGVSINDNPQVGLLMEVSPLGGNHFQVESKTIVSRLKAALVQPGITAEVLYDPQKPEHLQVLTLHIGEEGAGSVEARLEQLVSLRDKGLITEEEYRQKREEILKTL